MYVAQNISLGVSSWAFGLCGFDPLIWDTDYVNMLIKFNKGLYSGYSHIPDMMFMHITGIGIFFL